MFVPVLSPAMTDAKPSPATALTSLTPLRPLSCSSILRMMDSSISSGVAPGYGTETSMKSKASTGNASCTRLPIDTSPAATMKNISRLAATPCLAM